MLREVNQPAPSRTGIKGSETQTRASSVGSRLDLSWKIPKCHQSPPASEPTWEIFPGPIPTSMARTLIPQQPVTLSLMTLATVTF